MGREGSRLLLKRCSPLLDAASLASLELGDKRAVLHLDGFALSYCHIVRIRLTLDVHACTTLSLVTHSNHRFCALTFVCFVHSVIVDSDVAF